MTTGLVYDAKMLLHKCLWENHPERPERLLTILERCNELGLTKRCVDIPTRLATKEEILLVHTAEHLDTLRNICKTTDQAVLQTESSNFDSVFLNSLTYEVALLTAGSVIDLTKSVLTSNLKNGMAIVRPPGHHAMIDKFCGYCIINNVAVAARSAIQANLAERVLIVDFDVHHGQGTQEIFYQDSNVLYFSVHRYEHGKFWPNLRESNFDYIGEGSGKGYNVNVPLNKIGMGNSDYLTIWHEVLLPLTFQFQPDLILISAGYDSAMNDPKGQMMLSPQCYPHLVAPLMKFGKVVVVLEGGYCLDALSEGAALTLRALLDDPCPRIPGILGADDEVQDVISKLQCHLAPYWKFGSNNECYARGGEAQIPIRFEPPSMSPTDSNQFPTKNPNPVESFENNSPYDTLLKQLKLSTQLKTSVHKYGIYTNANQEFNSSVCVCNSKEQLIGKMLTSEISSGLILDSSKRVQYEYDIRSIHIKIGSQICGIEYMNGLKQLTICINEDSLAKLPNTLAFNLFASRLAPTAYKFDPDMIYISINFSPNNLRRIQFWIQLCQTTLSALGEGKLLFHLHCHDETHKNSECVEKVLESFFGVNYVSYGSHIGKEFMENSDILYNEIINRLKLSLTQNI